MRIKADWRIALLSLIVGVCIASAAGLIENEAGFVQIPENKYYGFPLIWRMINTSSGEE